MNFIVYSDGFGSSNGLTLWKYTFCLSYVCVYKTMTVKCGTDFKFKDVAIWYDENEEVSDNDEAPVSGSGPQVLVITDGGMGKRSFVSTYRKTNRGAKGVVSIRLKENESVVTAIQINDDDELLMTTECGQLVRIPANEVRTVGRASKGVKIMNLNADDRITGVAKFKEVEGAKSQENSEGNDNAAEIVPDAEIIPEETSDTQE